MIVTAEQWHAMGRPNARALLPGEQPSGRYAGLLVGALKRNSTPAQIENWRSREQQETALDRLASEGAAIVLYDEQGTSGRVLARREQALSLLEDISQGRLDGIYVHDIQRLTRDEYGADADSIARTVADARALFIISRQDYRLWLPQDLMAFLAEASLAGREVVAIRDTLYSGLLARAKHEPFFRSTPPFGYVTRSVEVLSQRRGQPERLRRIPIKDCEVNDAMTHLRGLFDQCRSLSEVATAMNCRDYRPVTRKGMRRGVRVLWDARRLRYMLDNPIYYGVWRFGRTQRRSAMWDTLEYREEPLEHVAPELAYWSRAQARAWIEKFDQCRRSRGPHVGYDRPLKGVLVCLTCGRVMLSAGAGGYQCPIGRYGRKDSVALCPEPQRLTHHNAMRLLLVEFPNAFRAYARRDIQDRPRLVQPSEAEKLQRQINATRERIDRLYFDFYKASDRPPVVPRAVKDDLAAMEQDLRGLEAKAARASEQESRTAQARMALSHLTGDDVKEQCERLPEGVQASLFRLTFAEVRIRTGGWAKKRTFELVSYRNLLTACNSLSGRCASAL